jgi:hypothetical protein
MGVQRRRLAGTAEGGAQVGEAVELAVLREEHLHHGAHRQPVVLDGVRRRLRRQLPRVDQPPQRLPLLFPGAWVCLQGTYHRSKPRDQNVAFKKKKWTIFL